MQEGSRDFCCRGGCLLGPELTFVVFYSQNPRRATEVLMQHLSTVRVRVPCLVRV